VLLEEELIIVALGSCGAWRLVAAVALALRRRSGSAGRAFSVARRSVMGARGVRRSGRGLELAFSVRALLSAGRFDPFELESQALALRMGFEELLGADQGLGERARLPQERHQALDGALLVDAELEGEAKRRDRVGGSAFRDEEVGVMEPERPVARVEIERSAEARDEWVGIVAHDRFLAGFGGACSERRAHELRLTRRK